MTLAREVELEMKKEQRRKLSLNKETLRNLDAQSMSRVAGGGAAQSATAGVACCSFPSDSTCTTSGCPVLRTCRPPAVGPCWCPPGTGAIG